MKKARIILAIIAVCGITTAAVGFAMRSDGNVYCDLTPQCQKLTFYTTVPQSGFFTLQPCGGGRLDYFTRNAAGVCHVTSGSVWLTAL